MRRPARGVALRTDATEHQPVAPALDPLSVTALVPCHRDPPPPGLVEQVHGLVGDVLLVDDGSPDACASALAALARTHAFEVLRLPTNAGKGFALEAGIRRLLSRERPPRAVLVVDADGQHPPAAIPAFLAAAAEAELVIGDRFGDARTMPWQRRLANRTASRLLSLSVRNQVRDSQCGMRLVRGRALHEVPFPGGRYEAETSHLKRCLRAGVSVAWVPIPALYDGASSSFRSVRDGGRVLAAAVF